MGRRYRAVDLFSGEGGSAEGYASAELDGDGFDIEGVDIERQPRYRHRFHRGNAATWPLSGYVFAHASPPCEDHSVTMAFGLADRGTGWLLPHTIERLRAWGGLWVVENVESRAVKAYMGPGAFRLCGSAFGLGAHDSRGNWRVLRRHRMFLANFPVTAPPCTCRGKLVGGVYGHGEQGVNGGRGYGFAADAARQALGMPWASRDGCAEAIPPAYTRFIGEQLLTYLRTEALSC